MLDRITQINVELYIGELMESNCKTVEQVENMVDFLQNLIEFIGEEVIEDNELE